MYGMHDHTVRNRPTCRIDIIACIEVMDCMIMYIQGVQEAL